MIPVADDWSSSSASTRKGFGIPPYLERGIMNNLWSGSGKSGECEIAARYLGREGSAMKADEYQGESEPCSSAMDAADRTERDPEMDRAMNNRILRMRSSSTRGVAAAVGGHRPFPFRTLIVCFTIWLIATQAMIFDQVKFDARTQLLEQAA